MCACRAPRRISASGHFSYLLAENGTFRFICVVDR
nr:MAG TPA: hypothetical protein [Caudoviricetes sp.]